jgi:hypothetical protein
MIWIGETEIFREPRPSATLFTINSTWTGMESNPGVFLAVGILGTVLRSQKEFPRFICAMLSTFPA